jgi:hypothetical protein
MKTQIRLILSTIALTALIWVYANRASQSMTTLLVPVKLTLADANSSLSLRVVDAAEDQPNIKLVKMTVRGPKQAINLLENEQGRGHFMLTVKVGEQLSPGRNSRNLFTDISNSSELLQRGLILQELSPEVVEFDVDRYIKLPVEVKPVAGSFESVLVGKPVVQQGVTARVLESKVDKGTTVLSVSLPIEDAIKEALSRQPSEADGPLELALSVPLQSSRLGVDATFDPPSVLVTVVLQGQFRVERKTVRPLSVLVKTQDFFDGGYEIEWEDKTGAQFTQTINVRVPVAKLDLFRQLDSTDIVAYVTIDSSDLPQEAKGVATTSPAPAAATETYRSKPVHFVFPPGFEEVKLVGADPTVNLRITKRSDTAALIAPPVSP